MCLDSRRILPVRLYVHLRQKQDVDFVYISENGITVYNLLTNSVFGYKIRNIIKLFNKVYNKEIKRRKSSWKEQ